jgi:hypothetical protein
MMIEYKGGKGWGVRWVQKGRLGGGGAGAPYKYIKTIKGRVGAMTIGCDASPASQHTRRITDGKAEARISRP